MTIHKFSTQDIIPQSVAYEALWIVQYLVNKYKDENGEIEIPPIKDIEIMCNQQTLVKRTVRDNNNNPIKSFLSVRSI